MRAVCAAYAALIHDLAKPNRSPLRGSLRLSALLRSLRTYGGSNLLETGAGVSESAMAVSMEMVGRVGFEPTTNWLKANCSTD